MLKRLFSPLALALAVAAAPTGVRAQTARPSQQTVPGSSDRFTLGGAFGGLSGAANLSPTGTPDWRLGWIGSVDGTVWLRDKVGIRASGSWAQDSIRGATFTGRGKFNKFTYDADVVLRYPIQAGSATFTP